MNNKILAIIGAIALIIISYLLLSFGSGTSNIESNSQNEIRDITETTQIQRDEVDTTEQQIDNELNKIEENLDMELSEEIQ